MLTFNNEFANDGASGCLLWADEPSVKRVRFPIGRLIFQDVLNLVATRGEMPVGELQRIEHSHPDQAVDPHTHDCRRRDCADTDSEQADHDCCDLRRNNRPKKSAAGEPERRSK